MRLKTIVNGINTRVKVLEDKASENDKQPDMIEQESLSGSLTQRCSVCDGQGTLPKYPKGTPMSSWTKKERELYRPPYVFPALLMGDVLKAFNPTITCHACNGKKQVPSDFGHSVLAFMDEYSKPKPKPKPKPKAKAKPKAKGKSK